MTHATVAGDDPIRTRLLPALVVGLVALAAAWVALLPGLAFWDTGELQAVAPLMGTAHPTGFPTYVLLGWLASILLQPFGEPAFRMNLFSAICLSLAAGVTERIWACVSLQWEWLGGEVAPREERPQRVAASSRRARAARSAPQREEAHAA